MAMMAVLILTACGADGDQPTDAADSANNAQDAEGEEDADEASAAEEDPDAESTDTEEDHLAEAFSGDIEIVVPYAPGGGYDLIARITASHLPTFLPGEQRILVQNVPGAREINGVRQVATSPADGMTLLHFTAGNIMYREFLGEEYPGFVARDEIEVIGKVHNDLVDQGFGCMRTENATNFDEAIAYAEEQGSDLTLSHTTASVVNQMLHELGDLPISTVLGFDTLVEAFFAVESGEVDGTAGCRMSFLREDFPHWIEDDFVRPIFLVYPASDEMAEFFEESGWDVPPTLDELLPDYVDLTEEELGVLVADQVLENINRFNFGVRSDTPDEIKAALTQALEDMANDEAFQAEMNGIERPPGWTPPSHFRDGLEELFSFPDEVHEVVGSYIAGN